MAHEINDCDQLRSPARVFEPDSRTHRVIEDQYETIACFKLNEAVPIEIAIHFETAKKFVFICVVCLPLLPCN